jgi:ArsR family transcriptional regulator
MTQDGNFALEFAEIKLIIRIRINMSEHNLFEMKEDNILKASKALKAMGHPLRLKILCVLSDGEMPVMDIVSKVGTTQSNVSQHIDILREKGIVASRRDGSKILCRVADDEIINLLHAMQSTFCPTD